MIFPKCAMFAEISHSSRYYCTYFTCISRSVRVSLFVFPEFSQSFPYVSGMFFFFIILRLTLLQALCGTAFRVVNRNRKRLGRFVGFSLKMSVSFGRLYCKTKDSLSRALLCRYLGRFLLVETSRIVNISIGSVCVRW